MREGCSEREWAPLGRVLALNIALMALFSGAAAQRLATLAPDRTAQSREFRAKLAAAFEEKTVVLESELAEAAYTASIPATKFNLTVDETKRLSSAIGCEFLLLIKSEMLRRSSFKKNEYYEAYAIVWLTSARSGRLVYWKNYSFEALTPSKVMTSLEASVPKVAQDVAEAVRRVHRSELSEPATSELEEPPDPASPLAKNFRPPVPYRRIKPEYTSEASLYEITATVEIVVDLDANGRIARTEIVRWAGYGLDESVERAVRAMAWRPAERNGKSLAMRFLLRYNFKKLDS